VCFIAVVVLSVIPLPEVPELEGVPLMDKWVHFVMYGGLTLCAWYDIYKNRTSKKVDIKTLLITFVYPTATGGLLELVQEHLTTTRNGDWQDFIADEIGVVIGIFLGITIVRQYAYKTYQKARFMRRKHDNAEDE
jgi:VanZ family protein